MLMKGIVHPKIIDSPSCRDKSVTFFHQENLKDNFNVSIQ